MQYSQIQEEVCTPNTAQLGGAFDSPTQKQASNLAIIYITPQNSKSPAWIVPSVYTLHLPPSVLHKQAEGNNPGCKTATT